MNWDEIPRISQEDPYPSDTEIERRQKAANREKHRTKPRTKSTMYRDLFPISQLENMRKDIELKGEVIQWLQSKNWLQL